MYFIWTLIHFNDHYLFYISPNIKIVYSLFCIYILHKFHILLELLLFNLLRRTRFYTHCISDTNLALKNDNIFENNCAHFYIDSNLYWDFMLLMWKSLSTYSVCKVNPYLWMREYLFKIPFFIQLLYKATKASISERKNISSKHCRKTTMLSNNELLTF